MKLEWLLLTGTPTTRQRVNKLTISTPVSQQCNKYFTSKVSGRQGRGKNKLINKWKIVVRWEKDCKISLNCQSIHPVQKFAQRRQVSTGPSINFVWGHTDGHEVKGQTAIIRPTAPHFFSYISTPFYSVISVAEGDLHQAEQTRLSRSRHLGIQVPE